MNEKDMTLTITPKEFKVLADLVVEAFKSSPLSKSEIITVMTLNTKFNEIEDALRRDWQ